VSSTENRPRPELGLLASAGRLHSRHGTLHSDRVDVSELLEPAGTCEFIPISRDARSTPWESRVRSRRLRLGSEPSAESGSRFHCQVGPSAEAGDGDWNPPFSLEPPPLPSRTHTDPPTLTTRSEGGGILELLPLTRNRFDCPRPSVNRSPQPTSSDPQAPEISSSLDPPLSLTSHFSRPRDPFMASQRSHHQR
jgi:hypothetical protein